MIVYQSWEDLAETQTKPERTSWRFSKNSAYNNCWNELESRQLPRCNLKSHLNCRRKTKQNKTNKQTNKQTNVSLSSKDRRSISVVMYIVILFLLSEWIIFFRHDTECFAVAARSGEEGWIPEHAFQQVHHVGQSKSKYVKTKLRRLICMHFAHRPLCIVTLNSN